MRPRHRWTLEVCTAIHERWMKGETLKNIALELDASPHALSRAIRQHGLSTPFCQSHILETRLQVREAPAKGWCRIDDCDRVGDHRGLCQKHYQIARRYWAVDIVGSPPRAKPKRAKAGQAVARG